MSDSSMAKQNKVKINATVSKPIIDKAKIIAGENFSNFVETAIVYYMGALGSENDVKLQNLETQLKDLREEYNELIAIILAFIKNNPELLEEYNELRKKQPANPDSVKKIKFE